MKKLYPSIFLAAIVISAIAATVKISDLTLSTSPSTNTFLEIADMNDTPKSKKYLLTNLVTVAQGQASTNALTNTFVLKAGDSMSGALTGPSSTWTNGITAGASTFAGTVTLTNSPTTNVLVLFQVPTGETNRYAIREMPSVITDGGGTYTDDLFQIGLNPTHESGLWRSYLQFESKFRVNGASPFKSELHWQWQSPDGLTTRRPITSTVSFSDYSSEIALAGLVSLTASDTSAQITKLESGILDFVGGSQLIRFATNNSAVFSQLNAAGDTYLKLPFIASDDTLYIQQAISASANKLSITNAGIDLKSDSYGIASRGTNMLSWSGNTATLTAPAVLNIDKNPYIIGGGTTRFRPLGVLSISYNPAVTNQNATNTDLMTYTIPAGTMAASKDIVTLNAAGTFAADADAKQIIVKFGATTVLDTGSLAFNGGAWSINAKVVRTGAGNQVATATFLSSSTLLPSHAQWSTPAETLANAIVFKVTATGTDTGDVVQRFSEYEFAASP